MCRDGDNHDGLDVGPHDRATGGECVCRGTGRRGQHHAVATPGGQRPSIDLKRDVQHALACRLLDRDLVQRPAQGDHALHRLAELFALRLSQESHVSQVDPQQRGIRPPRQRGTTKDRAVAAEHTDQLAPPSRVGGVGRDDVGTAPQNDRLGRIGQQGNFKTGSMKLVCDVPSELLGFDPSWVGDEQDAAGHEGASVDKVAASSVTWAVVSPSSGRRVNHSRYSAFPVAPRIGLARRALAVRPAAVAAATTVSITVARWCADRTTPPLPRRSRPTSNWGLTKSTKSPDGSTRSRRTGSTSRREMKLRSATSSSAGPPRSSARASRILTPEHSVTRGSRAISSASCPCPTSRATTSRAPFRNKTCVNPPVQAPTSKHRLSAASRPSAPNDSSAATSLYAARLTQSSTPDASSRFWSALTGVETFLAGDPSRRTEPALMGHLPRRSRHLSAPTRTSSLRPGSRTG